MKSDHQRRVEELMRLASQEIPDHPTVPSYEVRKLRATLILEEALETIEALGFEVKKRSDGTLGHADLFLDDGERCELVKVVDGCCDLRVVSTGTLSAFGVDDVFVQEEVDKNNLTKFGPGSFRREDGKWMKPPGFKGPDLARVLGLIP